MNTLPAVYKKMIKMGINDADTAYRVILHYKRTGKLIYPIK